MKITSCYYTAFYKIKKLHNYLDFPITTSLILAL